MVFSRDIFDEVEPLPMDTVPEDELLVDFALSWAASDNKCNNCHSPTLDDTTLDLDPRHPVGSCPRLPTVTDDNATEPHEAQSFRHSSVEEVFDTTMNDEEIAQWLKDMGLSGTAV